MESHIKQPGQPGFNPNHLNVNPTSKFRFPTFKGEELKETVRVKEFVDPTDVPTLSAQELQVTIQNDALAEIDLYLE
jgi:hypothetical protein